MVFRNGLEEFVRKKAQSTSISIAKYFLLCNNAFIVFKLTTFCIELNIYFFGFLHFLYQSPWIPPITGDLDSSMFDTYDDIDNQVQPYTDDGTEWDKDF